MCSDNKAKKNLPPKNNHNTQSLPPENLDDMPALPQTEKFEVLKEFMDILIYDSGTEDSERNVIFLVNRRC